MAITIMLSNIDLPGFNVVDVVIIADFVALFPTGLGRRQQIALAVYFTLGKSIADKTLRFGINSFQGHISLVRFRPGGDDITLYPLTNRQN